MDSKDQEIEKLQTRITELLQEGEEVTARLTESNKELEKLQEVYNKELQIRFLVERDLEKAEEENAKLVEKNFNLAKSLGAVEHVLRVREDSSSTTSNQPTFHNHKANKPKNFDGSKDKTDIFLNQLHLYFASLPQYFDDDYQKIIFALSYMNEGIAGEWARLKVEEMESTHWTNVFSDYTIFRTSILDHFGDSDRVSTAQHKLEMLYQGSQTADQYILDFERYQTISGYNDSALIRLFERGLNFGLADKIAGSEHKPTTLIEWKSKARTFDRNFRQREETKRLQSRTRPPTSAPNPRFSNYSKPFNPAPFPHAPPKATTTSHPPQPLPASGPIPMDVDAHRQFKSFGTCYNCNQSGHISRFCPHPHRERMVIRAEEEQGKGSDRE